MKMDIGSLKPIVSVVMSVYNGEKYLHEAIESILNQTFKDFEFIIINDGSTDNSAEIIKSFKDSRIVLIQQENRGLASALNKGIEVAKGKYIARMDADDICMPERLRLQVDYMESHGKCVLLSGAVEYIDEDGKSLYMRRLPTEDYEIKKGLPLSCLIIHPASFFRKEDFLKTNGYIEEVIQHIEDILLWNEFANLGNFSNIETTILKYRVCPGSITGYSRYVAKRKKKIFLKLLNGQQLTPGDKALINNLGKGGHNKKRARYLVQLGNIYYSQNRPDVGARYFMESLRYNISIVSIYGCLKCIFQNRRNTNL